MSVFTYFWTIEGRPPVMPTLSFPQKKSLEQLSDQSKTRCLVKVKGRAESLSLSVTKVSSCMRYVYLVGE